MSHKTLGTPDDPLAIGSGSIIAQLKRLRHETNVLYSLPPMWGPSRLRNEETVTNSSGSAGMTQENGEVRLITGANGSDYVELRSAQFAQYRSGLFGEPAFGIRFGSLPSANQVARWGYYDDSEGVGWGLDSTGLFTFRRKGGSDTTYRPHGDTSNTSNLWQIDSLNGWKSKENPSGVNFDPLDGAVFHNLFRLYGHGPVWWYVEPKKEGSPKNERGTPSVPEVAVDRRVYAREQSLQDFNKQLRCEVDNNGTASSWEMYVGGRQYSLWGNTDAFEQRDIPELVRGYSVGTADTWEPVMAFRKQPTFPPGSGRNNSVSVRLVDVETQADAEVEVKVTFDADVTNAASDWSPPEEWTAREAAIETIRDPDTALSVDSGQEGLRILHAFIDGSKSAARTVRRESQLPLGRSIEAVLWVRAPATSTSIDASVTHEEQW
jgi:hypothetical protein